MISIYFETTEILVTEKFQELTIVDILSRIGGLTGLWLGASLITLYQAVVYLIYGIVQNAKHFLCFNREIHS
jgi:hypothetical protein